MNPDDPKLTAYALGELDPAEQAEIEQYLRENPEAASEIEETRIFAEKLRGHLQTEKAEPLLDEQRAQIFAEVARPEKQPPVTASPVSGKIVAFTRGARIYSAIAACAIVGLAIAVLYPSLNQHYRRMHEMTVASTAREAESVKIQLPEPQTKMAPPESAAPLVATATPGATAETHPANQTETNLIALAGQPKTKIDLNAGALSDDLIALSPEQALASSRIASDLSKNNTITDASVPMLSKESAGENDGLGLIAANSRPAPATMSAAPMMKPGNPQLKLQPRARSKNGTASTDKPVTFTGLASAMGDNSAPAPATMPARTVTSPSKPVPMEWKRSSSGTLIQKREMANINQAKNVRDVPSNLVSAPSEAPVDGSRLYASLPQEGPTPKERPSLSEKSDSDIGEASFWAPYEPKPATALEEDERKSSTAFEDVTDNAFLKVTEQPLSTFSIDVDTAGYSLVRRFLNDNTLPPKGAVRIEELVNYFNYDYPQPDDASPFSVNMEVATCPWQTEHRLLRVALKGREMKRDQRPPSNLVFLIDVSGSMKPANKLPLLKQSLQLLIDQLSDRDQVSIVVYAGASGLVLPPTHKKEKMRAALDELEAGGSTHGSAGIKLAYETAEKALIRNGTNRVILATDGDFNVGITDRSELVDLIQGKAKSGIFLSVLGFGMDNLKDATLEQLADKGNGNYAYIDTLNEGRRVLVDQMNATLVTIAKDVKIQVEFNPAQVGAYRLIGYENRLLKKEDFNDDTKDAGEIGAGHTVTALYELVPAGKTVPSPVTDELKYQKPATTTAVTTSPVSPETSRELCTLKLRYKAPDADKSQLREVPFVDPNHSFENSTSEFRFASAVAGFGMLLRQSPYQGSINWDLVHEIANEAKGDDRDGYRTEFVGLIEKARALSSR